MDSLIYILPLFFVTALVYSTAGFAGGSTYIALLVLFGYSYVSAPKVALLCNLVVAAGGCYFFIKNGHFSVRKVLPFVITSIPAAYLGGRFPIGKGLFMLLLAFSLLMAGLRMLLAEDSFARGNEVSWRRSFLVGLPSGAVLGGLAGLTGIGGGIFISPFLFLLGWANAKEAAAAASFFIFVNSLAGLLGQLSKGAFAWEVGLLFPLALVVFVGGQIGSRLGAGMFPKVVLQRVTAVLILFVSGRLLWEMWFRGVP